VDLLGGVPHDAPQHIFEVFLRVDAQVAAGLDQGQDGGAGFAAILASYFWLYFWGRTKLTLMNCSANSPIIGV